MHRGTTGNAFGWPLALLQLLLVLSAAAAAVDDNECPTNVSIMAPEGARVVDGVLYAGNPEIAYQPSQYRAVQGGVGYRLCTAEPKPSVFKCCDSTEAFVVDDTNGLNCVQSDELPEEFKVPKSVTQNINNTEAHDKGKLSMEYQYPNCDDNLRIFTLYPHNYSTESFSISIDGKLLHKSSVDVPPRQFCIDQLRSESGFRHIALVCQIKQKSGLSDITVSALIISIPFLFMTILVYALTKDLRDLHGKCLICHVLSLLIAYVSLVIAQRKTREVYENNFCVLLGYSIQFFTLASFFWLNVMCIDSWLVFRHGRKVENKSKQLKNYALYAWGCSGLISIITYVADKWPDVITFIPTPEVGKASCWINSRNAVAIYFYIPMGAILLVNALIFIRIAVYVLLCMTRRPGSNEKLIRHKLRLCFELFIVMGLNWTLEIASSYTSWDFLKEVWFFTDIGNALQGVLIFVIFVCRERVLLSMNLQCCPRLRLIESSGPAPRQRNPVIDDASSNPTVTFRLVNTNFTDENQSTRQQNPDSHLLNVS